MHIFLTIITLSFFFATHNIYKNLCEPYITNFYLNIFVYIGLLLIGQSFWLLLNNNINKYLEYPIYITIFTLSFMFFYYIIIDIVRLFYLQNNIQALDLKILILAIILGIYGFFNRYNIRITEYNLYTKKDIKLKIAFMSDLHIGDSGINSFILNKTINKINNQKVDLVILGGDIIEQNPLAFTKNNFNEFFKKLNSTHGTYAILGNHEYYGGLAYKISEALEKYGNIKVLNDEVIEFKNFKLIGREDSAKEYTGNKRKNINEISKILPEEYNIVIDHNPINFYQSVENKADLQLSGHTHNGQFFPFNIIVKFFYEKPYGHLKKGESNLITSSGLSTWRIPIKLFSKPEIVIVNINQLSEKKENKN